MKQRTTLLDYQRGREKRPLFSCPKLVQIL
nr:MAG TPA: hypothetical protein [Caudoviricetes sp.]